MKTCLGPGGWSSVGNCRHTVDDEFFVSFEGESVQECDAP